MPKKKNLTELTVNNTARPAAGRKIIADDDVRGLFLRITSKGGRSWLIRYRVKGLAKQQTETLAPAGKGHITLAKARLRCRAVITAAKAGVNLPDQEKREQEQRRIAAARSRTLRQVTAAYVEHHCKPRLRSWKLIDGRFRIHVLPTLGDKAVGDLRRADVVELLDKLEHEKGMRQQVNRVRASIIGALDYAVEREWVETNVAGATKARDVETERKRTLTHDELRRLWRASEAQPSHARAFFRFVVLIGARREEAQALPWPEVDLDKAIWTLPPARNKSKREFLLPLSTGAVDLLKPLSKGKWAFTVDDKRPYRGHVGLRRSLTKASGVKDWTWHDLRRTLRSGLAELHVAPEVAERVLNHAVSKIERTYNRHAYLEEKATALQTWADHVAIIVSEGRDAPNVRELRTSA